MQKVDETRLITDQAEMIEVLGGPAHVTKRLGLKNSRRVDAWRARKQIAHAWRPTIADLLRKNGFRPPDDFLTPQAAQEKATATDGIAEAAE